MFGKEDVHFAASEHTVQSLVADGAQAKHTEFAVSWIKHRSFHLLNLNPFYDKTFSH